MSLTTEGDWADHINWLLKSSECIKRAAILGYPDASMWACSEDFKPIGEELQHLVHQFSDSKAPRIAHLEGVPFLARVKPTYVSGHKASTWFHAFKRNKGTGEIEAFKTKESSNGR